MIHFKKFVLIITIYLFNFTITHSSENIYFVDIDVVLNNSNLGKTIQSNLNNLNKKNIEKINREEKKIIENKNKIEKTKNISSKEVLEKELALYNQELNKFRKEKNDLALNFNKKKKEELNNFLVKINPIIEEYMETNSIDILIEKKNIFVGKKTKDATNAILELINKKYP
ncbi:OmpH family outer membrane protein [Candidatus Pelagibacter sp.]|nr:OmpH family outer membrane protein [Candidatus Pelagibacter sp.]